MKFSISICLAALLTAATALPSSLQERECKTINGCNSCSVTPNTCPECIRCCFDTCSGGTDSPNFKACYERTCLNSPGGLGTSECTC
ncbi:uncharacterized protein RCC_01915 [Ramularia collo-cygni]|uniref:Uncharacterized protein n=1 Tax=Ramularia collo-cygni TaxID=112498 RepID=A0A2D3URE2_9PEZI|nr:uncharacterized protein RCC_01915 [Ramularia collo-cygni]CZT16075.1 uncharacterized protein RCC_01915 [Ramularia collo-cygni]